MNVYMNCTATTIMQNAIIAPLHPDTISFGVIKIPIMQPKMHIPNDIILYFQPNNGCLVLQAIISLLYNTPNKHINIKDININMMLQIINKFIIPSDILTALKADLDFIKAVITDPLTINLLLSGVIVLSYKGINTLVHETFHKLTIQLTGKVLGVEVPPARIKWHYLHGFTYSDLYKYLELNHDKPKIQNAIRLNAFSGFIGEFIFHVLLSIFTLKYFCLASIFIQPIFILCGISFFKSSSDWRYCRKPDTFMYNPK